MATESPAKDAGLHRSDLIKEVNRTEVHKVQDFEKEIKGLRSGEVARLLLHRV